MPNKNAFTGTPRRRGRPSRDAEAMPREEILKRAFAAFARDGYDGVSLRALAAGCGVSDSLISHHFGTKQQLWYEAADSVFAPIYDRLIAMLDALVQSGDTVTALQSNLSQALKLMASDPLSIQFLFREGEGNDERGQYIRETWIRPYLARLDTLFERALEQGRYKPISPASRHVMVFGLMRSLVIPGLMRTELAPHLASPEAVSAYIDEFAELFYRGLELPPRRPPSPSYGDAP